MQQLKMKQCSIYSGVTHMSDKQQIQPASDVQYFLVN